MLTTSQIHGLCGGRENVLRGRPSRLVDANYFALAALADPSASFSALQQASLIGSSFDFRDKSWAGSHRRVASDSGVLDKYSRRRQ